MKRPQSLADLARPIIARLVIACTALLLPSLAWATPPADLAQRVETLRRTYGSPGATVAIVENGRTVFAQGFGVTDLAHPRPVNADTNFPTGSTGKAFTAAAIAVLVDQGRLRWDDKIIDLMPEFRMYDPWVTREMTVRDLLVHRSGLGLGAGDLLFVPRSNLTRAEVVRRLANIRPATSFRSAYAYDNILYMVAGALIERLSGLTWEQFMLRNVLRPAGMARTTVDTAGRAADRNRAQVHARTNGPIRGMGDMAPLGPEQVIADVAAPAGGLQVSANDMSHWLQLQLAHGALPRGRLFSDEQSRQMWTPQTLMPVNPLPGPLAALAPNSQSYALGWQIRDYRGVRLVMHSGGVYGGIAMVVLIPDRNVGFYIALNSEETAMLQGLTWELIDHYLGASRQDWATPFGTWLDQRQQTALAALRAPAAQPAANVGPSLPLARYAGRYSDPWFGTINIREQGGALQVQFPHWPGLTATLEHYQYDTFKTRYSDPTVEPAYVTFALAPNGAVERITLKAVSPIADFSYDYQDLLFTPAAATGAAAVLDD